jgi:AcrR family transcriptional regulator
MPKRVDVAERRAALADAVLRVAAARGLEGISVRHVAAEAGVTPGMVQHWFPTKDALMEAAMAAARDRYEARMTVAAAGLGEDPSAAVLLRAMLGVMLPLDDEGRADARVALAFQGYASTRPEVAARLRAESDELRAFLANRIRASTGSDEPRATSSAAALVALAEGLAVHVLGGGLDPAMAERALDVALEALAGA